MWDERFEELLRRHLPYLAPDEALEPDLPLRDYGLDSLASVELLSALEKAYGARLDTDDTTGGEGPDVSNLNGLPFYVGGDSYKNFVGELADVWIGVGQFLDLTVQANREKFIDANGKAADLGVDGSGPTGVAPAIFFHRDTDAPASDFASNRGTGGAFSLTGSLTASSTNPSD